MKMNSALRRVILSAATVMVLLTSVGTADALWRRTFSDISTTGDDIAVCADEITLEASISHETNSFEFSYPSFVPVVGVSEYPGGPDNIDLFASEFDVLNLGTPLAQVSITTILTSFGSTTYEFSGQATIPTPVGYGDGDVLYVRAIDESTLITIAVPLTIGDAKYSCPDVEPEPLLAGIMTIHNLVLVDSPFPHVLLFDAREVDIPTLEIAADDGSPTGIDYIGSGWGIGFAFVDLDAAGLTCDSTSLSLTGENDAGAPLAAEIPVNPIGWACF